MITTLPTAASVAEAAAAVAPHVRRTPVLRAEIDGRPVNYVDIGSGPREPLVFVHGLGGQWQNWLENMPRAARERRVIALDLPGFGLSGMPREEITIPRYGRTVEALIERLGLGRVDIVGNSMGGYIGAEVAIQFPQRVDQLLLVSAAGITSADLAHAPIMTLGRAAAAIATHTAAQDRQIASRPKSRHMALLFVARHPSRLKPDLAFEGFFKGTGKPGFRGDVGVRDGRVVAVGKVGEEARATVDATGDPFVVPVCYALVGAEFFSSID